MDEWLVVWNHGILNDFILGMSSSQLTLTPSFFTGMEWCGPQVAGHRGYFLTGPGVLLNQALINYGLSLGMTLKCPQNAHRSSFFPLVSLRKKHSADSKFLEHLQSLMIKQIGQCDLIDLLWSFDIVCIFAFEVLLSFRNVATLRCWDLDRNDGPGWPNGTDSRTLQAATILHEEGRPQRAGCRCSPRKSE